MTRKFIFLIILPFIFSAICFAETEGEKLFRTNKPQEAVVMLEKELQNGTASIDAYNHLGLAYHQLSNFDKAIASFEKGLNVSGTDKKILSFNQGNAYYSKGDFASSVKCYSLSLAVDENFTKALLNRANAYLMIKDYDKCIEDYELFLVKEPNDVQRPQIEEILALLRKHKIEQEEAARLAKEEEERRAREEELLRQELERQREEQARLEEEQRLAEEERRRKLLEDVANSLQNTDSTNMTAGAEDIISIESEPELD